jgi:hypothetical protein
MSEPAQTALVAGAPAQAVRQRDAKGRLLPGAPSLNPRGRPVTGLALSETIRKIVGPAEMAELVRGALDIALGRPVRLDPEYLAERAQARAQGLPDPVPKGESIQPSLDDMHRAREWLSRWGFRLPPQEVEVSQGGPGDGAMVDYARLTEAELDELEQHHDRVKALHAKALGVLPVAPKP